LNRFQVPSDMHRAPFRSQQTTQELLKATTSHKKTEACQLRQKTCKTFLLMQNKLAIEKLIYLSTKSESI
jgi:hypothetical protein